MEKIAFFKYFSYHKNIKTVQQMQGVQELVVTMRFSPQNTKKKWKTKKLERSPGA